MKVTEEEIRPEKVFDEYLQLTNKDVVDYFEKAERFDIFCPACGGKGEHWALKSGFSYKLCPDCLSIYVSPRPVMDAFNAYYTDSPSTKFWATTFYKVTEAARREKLWKPKAQMIKDRIKLYEDNDPVKYIIDIGGGYGVFDEEINKEKFREFGIEANKYYRPLRETPIAMNLFKRIINFPLHDQLTESQVLYVIEKMK